MLDDLCRRAPEVASTRMVAERCMVLLVVGNNTIFEVGNIYHGVQTPR